MLKRCLSIGLAFALAACGENAAREGAAEPFAQTRDELPVMGPERRILAFGDSLFAGYNVEKGESYPARLEVALRAAGVNARVSNAGISGDTSAAGLARIEFTLNGQGETPDLAIVELGGNDLLRGISPVETRSNLAGIIGELQERNIPVLLMGMRAPPNMGDIFQQEFDGLYADLAQQYDVDLVPFFLEAVYDKADLIQGDHIHPTARGIEELVAATSGDVAAALPAAP